MILLTENSVPCKLVHQPDGQSTLFPRFCPWEQETGRRETLRTSFTPQPLLGIYHSAPPFLRKHDISRIEAPTLNSLFHPHAKHMSLPRSKWLFGSPRVFQTMGTMRAIAPSTGDNLFKSWELREQHRDMVSLSLRMANSIITRSFFLFSDEKIIDLVSFRAILFAYIYT